MFLERSAVREAGILIANEKNVQTEDIADREITVVTTVRVRDAEFMYR